MRIYFDTCTVCRPLDDRSIPRNAVEREAVLVLFGMARRGELKIIISDVVLFEIDETPDEVRRKKLETIIRVVPDVIAVNEGIVGRGVELEKRGLRAVDAFHIAAAESEGVDYLCSTDDRLRKKCAEQSDLRVRVVSPLQLIEEIQS